MTTSISTTETLESLQATLEPLVAMHGEHTQLEAWVKDSGQALEKLHGELAEWQNELARKQTNLDLREDALEKCQHQEDEIGTQIDQWKADLAVAREESGQLKEENADQTQQLEQLERQCIALEAELKLAQQRSEELSQSLKSERVRAQAEQTQWKEEFKGMRELLDKQCSLLATQLTSGDSPARSARALNTEASDRSLELRKRAQARLAAKRPKKQEPEEPGQS